MATSFLKGEDIKGRKRKELTFANNEITESVNSSEIIIS